MKKEISVFELFKTYITESLMKCGVIDESKKNIKINMIIQDILNVEEEDKDEKEDEGEKYSRLMEKIRKCRTRGSVIQIKWNELIQNKVGLKDDTDSERRIEELNEDFFALLEAAINSSDELTYRIDANQGNDIERNLSNRIESYVGDIVFNRNIDILSKVYVFFIHGFYGRVMERIPHEANVPYLDRGKEPFIGKDWSFTWIVGPAYAGKTRFLLHYAENNNKSVVYCENPESYDEIVNQISFEEDQILDDEIRAILGCKSERDIKKEERIKHALEEFVLIVDGDRLKDDDIEKLRLLSKLDKIQVFVETRLDIHIDDPNQHVVYVCPFTVDDAINLFFEVSKKYGQGEARKKNTELNRILPDVCKVVCNNPEITILLAEHYWYSIKNNNDQSKKDAFKFLKNVIDFQPIGKMDKTICGKKYYSSMDYGQDDGNKQVQANILGHIRNLFKANVPEVEQSVFYVLALLNGIELRMNYLMNWFGISEMVIQELERDGWCTVDQENMIIGIPHLIVHAFGEDEFKNITELSAFKVYISNLSKTLNRREIQPTDVGIMQQVVLRLHDVFFVQLRKKISMLDESIYEFHFSCIRYYLYYGNAVQAEQLGTLKKLKIDEKYKSDVYEDILLKIGVYIGNNDLTTILDDIIDLLQTGTVFNSDFGTMAYLDMVNLWSEHLVMRCIRLLMECKYEELKSLKPMITSVQWIYYVIINMKEKSTDIHVRLKFYAEVFENLLDYENWSVDMIDQRVKHWDSIDEGFDELESKDVKSIEKKIYVKSLILVLYELYYFSVIMLGNETKSNEDVKKTENNSGNIHEHLRSRIQGIADQLLTLKESIRELPCNCADVCILSCGLAGVILHDKSLMKISEYDYKHATMYNQQQLKEMQEVIASYRVWGESE